MGGWTQIKLKDTSPENVAKHNALLEIHGVPKKYRFIEPGYTHAEYEFFKAGIGTWPEHIFDREKITSFLAFENAWFSVGDVFAPPFGTLQFDCYFGRTSKRAMRAIGKYLAENHDAIASFSGSYETFFERGMTELERSIMEENGVGKFQY